MVVKGGGREVLYKLMIKFQSSYGFASPYKCFFATPSPLVVTRKVEEAGDRKLLFSQVREGSEKTFPLESSPV